MTTTASFSVDVMPVGQALVPWATPLMRAMAEGTRPAGFSLLDRESPGVPDDPPHLDRAALADDLAASNQALQNPLDRQTLDAIRGDGWLIVTGQQPGLLTGPLYTVLKAITAVRLARDLAELTGRPVLPAFWIASEDHDIEEINHATIGSRTFTVDHEELREGGRRPPVGRLSPEPWREQIIGFVEQALPASPWLDELLAVLRDADWSSYTKLFASLFVWLLGPGKMVLIDPMALRPRLAPALAALAERAEALHDAFDAGTRAMQQAGHEPQVERINCFEFDQAGHRVRIEFDATLADRIRARPERYSPGAALRPLVQDAAMPVLATIGGPGEMRYLWQIDAMYAAAGLTRSRLWPRIGATLIDQRTAERGGRFGLEGADLLRAADRLDRFDPADFAANDDDVMRIDAARAALNHQLNALDAGPNAKLTEKAIDSINHQVDKLLDRVRNERLSRRGIGKGELKQLVQTITPHGKPAERVVSTLEWVGRFGRPLIDELIERLDPWSLDHRLITVAAADQGDAH